MTRIINYALIRLLQCAIDRSLCHDRALLAEHNARHPGEAFANDELKLFAPDLASGAPIRSKRLGSWPAF